MDWESCSISGSSGSNYNNPNQNKPYLEILVQPQTKFRFRYKSEMTGKHGSLLGNQPFENLTTTTGPSSPSSLPCTSTSTVAQMQQQNKVFPTVKLHNFKGEALIRVTLVCENKPHYPHPHLLEMGQPSLGEPGEGYSPENSIVEIPVTSLNDYTAVFQGLNIIYMSKKDTRKQLLGKISLLDDSDLRKIPSDKLDDLSLLINLNVVSLYFEAILRNPQGIQVLCNPLVSTPIQHNKSTQTGDLRIVRIDKFSSCCTGMEEVFILVEKVDKHNIQIKFYEENEKGLEIWKAYGQFSKLDVHHQYAIVFKTPAYRSSDIDTEVSVWIQLERISDGATSLPIPFKYTPIERIRKMPKRQQRRGGGGDSDNIPPESGPSSSRPFDLSGSGSNNLTQGGSNSNQMDNQGNNNLSGPSNIRQGADLPPHSNVCDTCPAEGLADIQSAVESSDATKSKALAMSVALSICQGLHGWAETSDFSLVLNKLRHLLCLVNENGDNALHSAIINEQSEPFARILETLTSSPDTVHAINEANVQNLTPITLAILANRMDFVQELVRHNVDLSIPNSEGDTPVHLAVKGNNILCLRILLQASTAAVAINKPNYSSLTPLHIAVSQGYTDIVDLLCSQKADLRATEGSYGRSPLHFAVEKETKESIICTMIILKYAGSPSVAEDLVNNQNYRGDTPLHCAASSGFTTLCALLLYHGGDSMTQNHVNKETEDEEDDQEIVPAPIIPITEDSVGQTVFDVAASEQVLRILKGNIDDWEIVLKACSPLLSPSSPSEIVLRQLAGSDLLSKDSSPDSKNLDSGIDVNNFNSSTFLNSSSNQLSEL